MQKLIEQFDKYGRNCPGAYFQALNHLLLFCNEEPEPEQLDTTLRYTKIMRQSLFCSIVHQCTGGRAHLMIKNSLEPEFQIDWHSMKYWVLFCFRPHGEFNFKKLITLYVGTSTYETVSLKLLNCRFLTHWVKTTDYWLISVIHSISLQKKALIICLTRTIFS